MKNKYYLDTDGEFYKTSDFSSLLQPVNREYRLSVYTKNRFKEIKIVCNLKGK